MKLTAQAKIGLFTIIAIIVLAVIIMWKTDIFMINRGYELIGSFNSVEGLTLGSEVRYRGLRVGKVLKIDPGPLEIRINAVIDRNIKFPDDSRLRVGYDGIVGEKYLEILPGCSIVMYQPPEVIYGVKTSGIVDFVDIGAQNLEETKRILENIRIIVENPQLQQAFMNTVFTADKVATDLELLTTELRQTNAGIRDIVADPKFQANVKGTIQETEKTLSSANQFFDSVSHINVRASAGIDVGSQSNSVKGDIDIVRNEGNYFRFGIGEGPSRQPSLLDMLFTSKINSRYGYRLGLINNQIGGGLAIFPNDYLVLRGDIYDINNPRPAWPKMRLGLEQQIEDYMDLTFKADDLLNSGSRNVTIGIKVKGPGEGVD